MAAAPALPPAIAGGRAQRMQPVAGIDKVKLLGCRRAVLNVWWHLPAQHTCCHRGWNRVEPALLVSGRSVPLPSGSSGAWAGVAAGVQCMQQQCSSRRAGTNMHVHLGPASATPACNALVQVGSHPCLLPDDQPHRPASEQPATPASHPALIHSGWPWSVRRSTHFTPPFTSSAPAAHQGPGPAAAAGRMTVNAGRAWAAVHKQSGRRACSSTWFAWRTAGAAHGPH